MDNILTTPNALVLDPNKHYNVNAQKLDPIDLLALKGQIILVLLATGGNKIMLLQDVSPSLKYFYFKTVEGTNRPFNIHISLALNFFHVIEIFEKKETIGIGEKAPADV